MEIACDESGYEGEKLIGTTTELFAHGSVRLETRAAAGCMAELRERIRSPATQYKAGHVLREKHRAVLEWLLGPSGPIQGKAHVFLIDKQRYVISKLVGTLLGDEGFAGALHLDGPREFGPERWTAFLVCANDLMRSRDRPGTADPVDSIFEALRALESRGPAGRILRSLRETRPRVEARRRELRDRPDSLPPLDPLVPAIACAVERWSEGGKPIDIVHDRQKILTPQRIERLMAASGGRLAGIRLADSSVDPRVQVADVVAGAVRKLASDELHGRGDPRLTELSHPFRA